MFLYQVLLLIRESSLRGLGKIGEKGGGGIERLKEEEQMGEEED